MKMKLHQRIMIWFLTFAVCFIIIWPVYWIVKSSLVPEAEIFSMPVDYIPNELTLESYRVLLRGNRQVNTMKYISDTVLLAASVLLLTSVLCSLAGYAFARGKSRGINRAFVFIIFSTMVPGTVATVPLMVLWRSLKLTDTMPGLTLLYVSAMIPFSTIMFSTYIRQIPMALEEAAWIDGTGMLGAFFRIIFPLLTPILSTLCIINFINSINEFFFPLIFTTKNVKVLSMLLYNVPRLNEWQEPWGTISAAGCLMMLPTVIFILLFERRIMSGLMMGSIKA